MLRQHPQVPAPSERSSYFLMLYTDLNELKSILDIAPGNQAEDRNLNFMITHVSSWIEEILNRPGMSYASRTEFYDGTNTPALLLRSRPVFTTPTIQVWVDSQGAFGAASGAFTGDGAELTWGNDFYLRIDQDNGSSRSGILYRNGGVWNKRTARQQGWLSPFVIAAPGTIKVTYTAGFTVETLPPVFRQACELLIARLRTIMPLGMEIGSESYEERSISLITPAKDYLINLVKPMLWPFRNWKF